MIVEGYMDAAMAHQHGYRNVVATLGTAVTDRHLRLLQRQVDEIVLALDADAAGQAATWRTLQVADESLRSGLTPVVGPNRRQQRFVADRVGSAARAGAAQRQGSRRSDSVGSERLAGAGAGGDAGRRLRPQSARSALRPENGQGKAAAAAEIADVLAGIADPDRAGPLHQRSGRPAQRRAGRRPPAAEVEAAGAATAQSSAAPAAPQPATEVQGDIDDEYLLALLMRLRDVSRAPPTSKGR